MLSSWKTFSTFRLPSKRQSAREGLDLAQRLDTLLAALWPLADKDMLPDAPTAEGVALLNGLITDLLQSIKANYLLNMEIEISRGRGGAETHHVLSLDLYKLQSALMHITPGVPPAESVVHQLNKIYFDLNEFQLEAEKRSGQ